MKSTLLRLARSIYRTPAETTALSAPFPIRIKLFALAVGWGILALAFLPAFLTQVWTWNGERVNVAFEERNWKALYSDIAEPNRTLWESPHDRGDLAVHTQRQSELRGKAYWIGTRVDSDLLRRAAKAGANHLVIGYVRGSFALWIDGDVIVRGSFWDNEPLIIPIAFSRLSTGKPLEIAIRNVLDADVKLPGDLLAPEFGTGFATKAMATSYRRFQGFWVAVRPFALFMANALLAGFFFMAWLSAKEKQEYFYIAAYALLTSLIHLRLVDFVLFTTSRDASAAYKITFVTYQSIFLAFVGFSFARVRPAVFRWGLAAMLPLPALIYFSFPDSFSRHAFSNALYGTPATLMALIGAIPCLLQAWMIHEERKPGRDMPVRARRLVVFALCLIGIGVIAYFDVSRSFAFPLQLLWNRMGHFVLLVYLGFTALRDYQVERQLIERSPISQYHRRPTLPDRLRGAVLTVDIKGSEKLFRLGAEHGNAGEIVESCLSRMWAAIIDTGGVVIGTEGDAIRSFFDAETHPNPIGAAIRATQEMALRLNQVESHLENKYDLTVALELRFRGAVAAGEIKPVWQVMGSSRYPSWIETGSSNVLVTTARLTELEREIPGDDSLTRIVLDSKDAAHVADAHPVADELIGKHGRAYRVAVYLPTTNPNRPALKLVRSA